MHATNLYHYRDNQDKAAATRSARPTTGEAAAPGSTRPAEPGKSTKQCNQKGQQKNNYYNYTATAVVPYYT